MALMIKKVVLMILTTVLILDVVLMIKNSDGTINVNENIWIKS